MNNEKRIAIVTGGYHGIGKGIAEVLAGDDVVVIVTTRKKQESVANVPEEIGKNIWGIAMNVLDQKSIENGFQICKDFFGIPNILVNNAGVYVRGSTLEMQREEWNLIMDTNLSAVFWVSQYFSKQLISLKKGGNIVNISSNAAFNYYPLQIAYNVSKESLNSLTRQMAKELKECKIRVNAICPGSVYTQMLINIAQNMADEQNIAYDAAINSLKLGNIGRFVSSEEIGHIVKFLISDSAEIISGQVITADAGLT